MTAYSDLVHDPFHAFFEKLTLRDGLGFSWDTFVKPFAFNPNVGHVIESRPRYLTYFLLGIDEKINLLLYQWLPPHPSASIYWPITLVATPYLIFRFLIKCGAPRTAALIAVALYISSVGYLSNVTLNYHPGKPFTNVLVVVLFNLGVDAWKKAQPQKLLCETGPLLNLAIGVTLFLGLITDETTYISYFFLAILWPSLFLVRPITKENVIRMGSNLALFSLPGIAFLLVTFFVYPILSPRLAGYEFNFFSNSYDGIAFTLSDIYGNFSSLVGTSIAPWPLSPWVARSTGAPLYEQVDNLPKMLALAILIVGTAAAVWRGPDNVRGCLRTLLPAYFLFLIWHSFLFTFHIGVVNGYFYGSVHAVFFSIIVALVLASGVRAWRLAPAFIGALTALIICIQVVNFHVINRSFVKVLTGGSPPGVHPAFREGVPFTFSEANALWRCWRHADGACDVYKRPVTRGAAYLLGEFENLDNLSGR
jgi:hypothetical protein